VTTAWTSPASATLDKGTGATIDETMTDALASDLYHLGGTTGTISCRAAPTVAQSISNSTLTAVTMAGEIWESDPNGAIHDLVTNNSRLTCRTTGTYMIIGFAEWAANATGIRNAYLRVNGATVVNYDQRQAVTGGDITAATVSAHYQLTATDYVELIVLQSSGGALNLTNASLSMAKT
jgi:hypothetical protein